MLIIWRAGIIVNQAVYELFLYRVDNVDNGLKGL